MIIIRYLLREAIKNQLAIFCILLFVFLCQRLVKILDAVVNCELPSNLVIFLVALGIPETTQLILPFSLFLGIQVTLSRFYTEGMITVMFACGLSKTVLIKMAMVLALITSFITIVNVTWVSPLSSKCQYEVLEKTKTNSNINFLKQRKFQKINNSNSILFVDSINKNGFKNAFLAQFRSKENNQPSIIVAKSGRITKRPDGSQIITLDHGSRFEVNEKLREFRITNFQNYQIIIRNEIIKTNCNNVEQMNVYSLLSNRSDCAHAELHWRLMLVFAVFVMALMAVPLSSLQARQGRVLSSIPTIFLYLVFFLLQGAIRSNGTKGRLDSALWTWLLNSFYLLLAVLLNTWNIVIVGYVRRIITSNRRRKNK